MKKSGVIRLERMLSFLIFLAFYKQELLAIPNLNATYFVVSVTGRVQFRSSLGSEWLELKPGMTLREGQLVQVGPHSKVHISLKDMKRSKNNSTEGNVLIVTQATTFRLNPTLLRKVELSKYVFKNMSQIDVPIGDLAGGQSSYFDEAWNRVSAVIFRNQAGNKLHKSADSQELENRGIAIGGSYKHLEILSPGNNSIFQAENFPFELTVIWPTEAGSGTKYNVYCWKVSEQRHAFQGSSKDDQYNLLFLSPGSYYIQVVSNDSTWQSTASIVHIERKTSFPDESNDNVTAKTSHFENSISLKYPLPQLRYITQNPHASIEFQWQLMQTMDPIALELLIDGPEQPQRRIALPLLAQGSFPVDLSKGRYSWAIAVKWKQADKVSQTTSPAQTFYVQTNESNFQSIFLDELKNSQLSGTLYLENGF